MAQTIVKPTFSKKTYLEWYELMKRIREFETACYRIYASKFEGKREIQGFLHVSNGQEAVAAGMTSAMNKDDIVITAYRDHGNAIAKGISTKECMAELFGKITGCTKGKGGSMHFFDKEKGFWGGHGIVGAQIPLGAGIAFSEKYRGSKNVCFTMFGDGAARQGALHEAFNMAMNWKLPVVFICENNKYAMGTSVERTSNVHEIYKLGRAYEMPSEPVDGMSCEAVHKAIAKACKHVRSGKGPYFLEINTYRYHGHSISDPKLYRSRDEEKDYKGIDPLKVVKATILENKFATEKKIKAIDDAIKKEIQESIEFARSSAYPDDSELFTDVYLQEDYPFIKD